MKGILSALVNFFSDGQTSGVMNMQLLLITLMVLLIALWICIFISKRNKLYIRSKGDEKDNAYT